MLQFNISNLGSGMNYGVFALAFDLSGNLYAGGEFTTAGGVPASRVAKWDGNRWSALGSGTNDFVKALASDLSGLSGNLYAGGNFTYVGGVRANRVAEVQEITNAQNFYLPQLDVFVDASYALLTGILTQAFDGSANVDVNIPLTHAKNIFQFQTDSVDINNTNAQDIKYKVVYDITDPSFNIQFNLDTSANVTSNLIHSGASNNNVTYDYVRYLASKLFNTHLGVDLFSNETELREDLRDKFSVAFNTNMISLRDQGVTTASVDSPSKSILLQVISNQPARLSDITSLAIESDWHKSPLIAGDILYFRLTINAAANQNNLTNVTSIGPRVYLIKATLV